MGRAQIHVVLYGIDLYYYGIDITTQISKDPYHYYQAMLIVIPQIRCGRNVRKAIGFSKTSEASGLRGFSAGGAAGKRQEKTQVSMILDDYVL